MGSIPLIPLMAQQYTPDNLLDDANKAAAYRNALADRTTIQQNQAKNAIVLDQMRRQAEDERQTIAALQGMYRIPSTSAPLLAGSGPAPMSTFNALGAPGTASIGDLTRAHVAAVPGAGSYISPASLVTDPFGQSMPSAPAPAPAPAPGPASSGQFDASAPAAVAPRPRVPTIAELVQHGVPVTTAPALVEKMQAVAKAAYENDKLIAEADNTRATTQDTYTKVADAVRQQEAQMADAILHGTNADGSLNPALMHWNLQHFASQDTVPNGPFTQAAQQIGAHLSGMDDAGAKAFLEGLTRTPKQLEAGAKASEAQTAASKYADDRLDKDTAQLAARLGATTSQSDWGSELGNASPAAIARLNPPAAWSQTAAKTMLAKGSTAAEQVTAAETAKQHGIENANKQAELNIQRAELAFRRASIENVQLTPQALDQMATMFATTGVLPNLGMGAAVAATRSGIINRAAQMYPNVSFSSNAAAYQANKHSLNTVTGALDTLTAFEGAGLKNLKMFTDAAAKLPDTGVPWLNTPVRLLDERTVGSQNMAVVNAARDVALREIARVTNDPKLSGVLSDSARHEVQSLSPKDATIPQIMAVAQVLRQDMANVHQSLQDQKDAIGSRLGASPAGATATNTPNETPKTDGVQQFSKGDKVLYNGKQHTVIGYAANGKLQLSE